MAGAGEPGPAAGGKAGEAGRAAAVQGPQPLVSLVAAADENGVIGSNGGLAWHLPDDLRHFKALTLGKLLLMGRTTFEAIGRPLPGRTTLVLTRAAGWSAPGVGVVHSLEQALAASAQTAAPELVIAGGEQVYRLALPLVRRIHLTRVHAAVAGDVHLPQIAWSEWREVARSEHPADERHAYAMSFITLERV